MTDTTQEELPPYDCEMCNNRREIGTAFGIPGGPCPACTPIFAYRDQCIATLKAENERLRLALLCSGKGK
jgi:hypothetical protein